MTPTDSVSLSEFALGLRAETAFDVLAVAKQHKARGKDVVELQIGDSPFPSTSHAIEAGTAAIRDGHTHYCPSPGLPSFRETIAKNFEREFGVSIGPQNVVVGAGAKIFEQLFCEAFLEPGDAVLVFTPHFPTYSPNLQRRGADVRYSSLRQENHFRPNLDDVQSFVDSDRAKAIFLNTPHNPTGGVATKEDLAGLAQIVRGRNIAVFSDEPYCHMVWSGEHATLSNEAGMLEQSVSAFTFSKSYSMSGWRLGYAIAGERICASMSKMINTTLSCVPPFVQLAGQAALEHDADERDAVMAKFERKVQLLVQALGKVDGCKVFMPAGTFYVFPNVSAICSRLGMKSHGLAMYLLEGADDDFGVACLGGECFGEAGQGFLRFSCAEPDERLERAVEFFSEAITRQDRVAAYLEQNPHYRA